MATFAEDIFLMMTREEVAEVITYCKKNDIFYKTRLAELGIPVWKFYDSKSRYALEQESSEANGEFLLLYAGGSPAPVPSFQPHRAGRKPHHPGCLHGQYIPQIHTLPAPWREPKKKILTL